MNNNVKIISNDINEEFKTNIIDYLNVEVPKILEFLELKDIRQVKMFLFIPEYCRGTIQNGDIYFLLRNYDNKEIKNILHEYIHIIYNEYIINKDMNRIVWLDEGLAQVLSKQEIKINYDEFPQDIDLNNLTHKNSEFGKKKRLSNIIFSC